MFFSVIRPIRIGGRVYRPCICYDLASYLRSTVEKLEKEGTAKIYNERVYFCNGKIVEKEVVENKDKTESSKENSTSEKKQKRTKKEETKEEDIPSPEEIADNETIEDF